ncbi:hypothetical protein QEN58_06050 [Halomonas alkaliantarctica]|uniref:Uncharacterized protein n=1 Tax=Halomonas alkaliantarctica TaxID=232346 RepID=A0ABY8LQC0_9GAMM|nr:hypothetical protein [Halomonas alkaliantarctica]WGI26620.1 hypothetical protein QEN58_06050 [Halomonas alkaliantarctica]
MTPCEWDIAAAQPVVTAADGEVNALPWSH